MYAVDQLSLSFDGGTLWLLSIVLGIIMFGIALDLRSDDFRRVRRFPLAVLAGVLGQFVLLPALTFLLVQLLQFLPAEQFTPSMALGMFLVAACPGGNMSNFFSHLAKGATGLSVTLTAISSVCAIAMTPINFVFWASMDLQAAGMLQQLLTDMSASGAGFASTAWFLFQEMFIIVLLVLGVPLGLGMLAGQRYPQLARRARKPFKIGSLLVFALLVVLAMLANWQNFLNYIAIIFGMVLIHNVLALASGWCLGRLFGVPTAEKRSLTIEVGIQNSGLGLVLIFTLFGGLGGMALIAAWWGVWHLLSGTALGLYWSRIPSE